MHRLPFFVYAAARGSFQQIVEKSRGKRVGNRRNVGKVTELCKQTRRMQSSPAYGAPFFSPKIRRDLFHPLVIPQRVRRDPACLAYFLGGYMIPPLYVSLGVLYTMVFTQRNL